MPSAASPQCAGAGVPEMSDVIAAAAGKRIFDRTDSCHTRGNQKEQEGSGADGEGLDERGGEGARVC